MIAPNAGIYDVAYDIWLNGVATSTSNEVMIWTQNHKQVPPGSPVATRLTFPGSYTGTWNLYVANANHYLAFVPANGQVIPSGWVDVKSVLNYLVAQGRIPSGSTLGAVDYGVEVVDTGGSQVTFNCTDFSITDH
jgi:hypothetical protein